MSVRINGVEIGACPKCGSDAVHIRSTGVVCVKCGHQQKAPEAVTSGVVVEAGSVVVTGGSSNLSDAEWEDFVRKMDERLTRRLRELSAMPPQMPKGLSE